MKQEKRNFRLKMHLACGTDDLRPILSHIYFENGFMIATDAHILVKAAIQNFSDLDRSEVDLLNGKFLHRNTFKKLLSCSQVAVTEEGIQDLATKDIYRFADPGGKYPNYEAVIPTEASPISEIGINPKTANKLLQVLSCDDVLSIKLNFTAANRAIKINGIGDNEGALTCVLMPVMLHD